MSAETPSLTLVSHVLCPYVQRAAIVLVEKGAPFVRRDVDLAAKPEWFLAVSPLGKTPVLLVGEQAVFESAVIVEYLDETIGPRLLPAEPLARARQRAWIAAASAILDEIAGFYNAPDEAGLQARRRKLDGHFARVEQELATRDGEPWFAGQRFGLVDAAFAPVFRYVDAFESIDLRFLDATPRVTTWRAALASRTSVREAVPRDYPERLDAFLRRRGSALSRRMLADATT